MARERLTNGEWNLVLDKFRKEFPGRFLYTSRPGDGTTHVVFRNNTFLSKREALAWMTGFAEGYELGYGDNSDPDKNNG